MSVKKLKPPRLIKRQVAELLAAFLDGLPYEDLDFQEAIDKDMKRMQRKKKGGE